MPTGTPASVRKQIASATPDSVYLLQGEDDVEKSAVAAEFADLVEEGLRAFNVDRVLAGGHRRQAAAGRYRSSPAVRARTENDHGRRCEGDRGSGSAPGRLGDDQRDRRGTRGRGAPSARAHA